MSARSSDRRWGSVAKFFHWSMALLILGNGIWGLLMADMKPSMNKINLFALHKSIGLTVLALYLLRVAWRMLDKRPPDLPMPRWQRLAAHGTHALLYVIIIAMPLTGWWFNSLRGFALQYFKLFNLPALAGKNEALASTVVIVHQYLYWGLLAVLVAHVGGALKHHFSDRDDVLRRMLPFGRPKRGARSSARGPSQ